MIRIIAILIAGPDHKKPKSYHFIKTMRDEVRVAPIVNAARKTIGDPETFFNLPKNENTSVRRKGPSIKPHLNRQSGNR